MKKSILTLKGTQKLSKKMQQSISGGRGTCNGATCENYDYPYGFLVTCAQYLTIPSIYSCCVLTTEACS